MDYELKTFSGQVSGNRNEGNRIGQDVLLMVKFVVVMAITEDFWVLGSSQSFNLVVSKPGCLQFLCGGALLCSFACFCVRMRLEQPRWGIRSISLGIVQEAFSPKDVPRIFDTFILDTFLTHF